MNIKEVITSFNMNSTVVSYIDAHSFPEEDKLYFPSVSKPTCIGAYSVSPFESFERNVSRMRFIDIPPSYRFPLNLRNPNRQVEPLKPPQERIDNMLIFIESMWQKLLRKDDTRLVVNADVVCTKEVLELIMFAPFEYKYGWTLGVSRFRKTIYICVLDRNQPDNFDQDNLRRVMQEDWLKNLRKQCLSDNGKGKPNKRDVSDENSRCNAAFSFELNGQHILFDSPVIAEFDPNKFSTQSYAWSDLQLRVDNMTRNEWAVHNRTESIKWWIRSFLIGMDHIYVANRDDNAFVRSIKRTPIQDLYRDSDETKPFYSTHFLKRFLSCITQVMGEIDNPSTVYTFEYDAKLGKVTHRGLEGRNQHTFVADWFRLMLDDRLEDAHELQRMNN
ncbi:uncharacterized protein Dana_GF13104, isoform A [Drosophila ananassae]|uniref:Decapping nuclease n=1 Tax=Drosophila ananassae TaxID=7217 RepID=B3MG34_DROAN|nr:protein cutoff isoform X2 [Drosophila ananassae]EDV36729.1 uncharacterized protein Dana_GF13104, isoform A [Drosophila ananassae]KAH8316281.1 hypothetical protein KR067_004186 [Drosophila pandora]